MSPVLKFFHLFFSAFEKLLNQTGFEKGATFDVFPTGKIRNMKSQTRPVYLIIGIIVLSSYSGLTFSSIASHPSVHVISTREGMALKPKYERMAHDLESPDRLPRKWARDNLLLIAKGDINEAKVVFSDNVQHILMEYIERSYSMAVTKRRTTHKEYSYWKVARSAAINILLELAENQLITSDIEKRLIEQAFIESSRLWSRSIASRILNRMRELSDESQRTAMDELFHTKRRGFAVEKIMFNTRFSEETMKVLSANSAHRDRKMKTRIKRLLKNQRNPNSNVCARKAFSL